MTVFPRDSRDYLKKVSDLSYFISIQKEKKTSKG